MRRKTAILNLVLAAGAIGAGVGGYLATGTSTTATAVVRSTAVQRGTVLSTISSSGNIEAAHSLTLSFTGSGTLVALWARAGQAVKQGQQLAQIDPTTAQQTVRTATASLASAEANYQTVLAGQTAAQRRQNAISVTQSRNSLSTARTSLADTQASLALNVTTQAASVAQARQSLAQAQATIALTDKSLQASVDQAKKAVALARTTVGNSAQGASTTLALARAQLATDLSKQNVDIGTLNGIVGSTDGGKTSVQTATAALTNDSLQLQQITEYQTANGCSAGCPKPNDTLSQKQLQFRQTQDQAVLSSLNTIAADATAITKDQQAIDSATLSLSNNGVSNTQSLTNATTSYNNAVTALQKQQISDAQTLQNARNQLQSALNSQTSGQLKDAQTLHQAQQSVANAQLSLENTVVGNEIKTSTAPSTIAQAQASLQQAQASLKNAQEALDQTILRAPIAGTIASVNGLVGTTVSSGGGGGANATSTGFITLVDLSHPLVQVGFSESDAAKIKLGQLATLTVSALPNVQLAAHVAQFDTTSTLVSNVVTYYATLQLDRTDSGVKPGMTVSASVIVGKSDNALHVPTAAVRGTGGTGTVTLVDAKGVQTRATVATGLAGDDQTVILSGLKEGDNVVVSTGSIGGTSGTTGTPSLTGGLSGGLGGGLGGGGGGRGFRLGG